EKVADSLQAAPIEEPEPKENEVPVQQNIEKSVNTNTGNDFTIETKPVKVAPQKKYFERRAKTKVSVRQKRATNANVAASSQSNNAQASNAQASQITDPQIYVIQFYASPSQSDAEQWLRKVQNKVGNKAYISTQIVRDQVWYRVRCGTFSTKEEATVAARKYGFSQSWVDRIR
ncbi:MAG: SPOR domain-containing protein, partial [Candidatus Kapabacteria bacterium]|nr:SPOR domain-containing protein [Candidatus Kapabacteria bacterium]